LITEDVGSFETESQSPRYLYAGRSASSMACHLCHKMNVWFVASLPLRNFS